MHSGTAALVHDGALAVLKRTGQVQDFPWGHKQQVLARGWSWGTVSWSTESCSTAAATEPPSPEPTAGPSDTLKTPLPLQLRGLKQEEHGTQNIHWSRHMENTKESLCTHHKLICEITYTATWKKHLRNFLAKGQNNLHSLCWTLGSFPPVCFPYVLQVCSGIDFKTFSNFKFRLFIYSSTCTWLSKDRPEDSIYK